MTFVAPPMQEPKSSPSHFRWGSTWRLKEIVVVDIPWIIGFYAWFMNRLDSRIEHRVMGNDRFVAGTDGASADCGPTAK